MGSNHRRVFDNVVSQLVAVIGPARKVPGK
jgi:hypothetical protein